MPRREMKPGPLHWCEVLEDEHSVISAERQNRTADRPVRSAESWLLKPNDIRDLKGFVATFRDDPGLWSWVAKLPRNVLESKESSLKTRIKQIVSAKPPEENFRALVSNRLGVSIPDSFDSEHPSKADASIICDVVNALLRLERLDEAEMLPRSLSSVPDAWETELDELLAAGDARLLPEDICHRNRLLFEKMFRDHIEPIHRRRTKEAIGKMHSLRLSALCLSGGGIRSATFGLGVLQGLARQGLMSHFDYLSTVSGGGYIGSWFSSW